MPGQFNPMNPAGGLGPGQGFLSRGLGFGGGGGGSYGPVPGLEAMYGTVAPGTIGGNAAGMPLLPYNPSVTGTSGPPSTAGATQMRPPPGPGVYSQTGVQPGAFMGGPGAGGPPGAPNQAIAQMGQGSQLQSNDPNGQVPEGTQPQRGTINEYLYNAYKSSGGGLSYAQWVNGGKPNVAGSGSPGSGTPFFSGGTQPPPPIGGGGAGGGLAGNAPPSAGINLGGVLGGPQFSGDIDPATGKSYYDQYGNNPAGGFEAYLRGLNSPFAGDPAGLPGKGAAGLMGTAAEQTRQLAIAQQALMNQAFGGIQGAISTMGSSPFVSGATGVGGDLAANPYTTSSDALQAEIEAGLGRRYGTARQGLLSGFSEGQGAAGATGGEASLLRSGADFGARTALADAYAQSRVDQAMRRATDIQNAMAGFVSGGNIYGNQLLAPQMAGFEAAQANTAPATGAYLSQLQNLGILSTEDVLREAYSPTAFEKFLSLAGPALDPIFGTWSGASNTGGGGGGQDQSGNAGLIAGLLQAISDFRVKTDIRRTGFEVGGVPVVTFRYRSGGPVHTGVVAQEAEVLRPDVVFERGGYKHVDYGRLLGGV